MAPPPSKSSKIPKKFVLDSVAFKPATSQDHNDWPIFLLESATVYTRDGTALANLLNTELQGPFVVRGKLVVERDSIRYLSEKKYANKWIELTSHMFSTGCEPSVIWCSGFGGWYEIEPSQQYQEIYDEMIQGIDLGYDVIRYHEEVMTMEDDFPKLEDVFWVCATGNGSGLSRDELTERLLHHAPYFISQLKGATFEISGTDFTVHLKESPFFQWLIDECPALWKKIKAKGKKATNDSAPQSARQNTPAPILPPKWNIPTTKEILPQKGTPSKTLTIQQKHSPNKNKISSNAYVLTTLPSPTPQMAAQVQLILSTIHQLEQNTSFQHKTRYDRIHHALYRSHKGPDGSRGPRFAKAVMAINAPEILAQLKRDPQWKGTNLYDTLQLIISGEYVLDSFEPVNKPGLEAETWENHIEAAQTWIFERRTTRKESVSASIEKDSSNVIEINDDSSSTIEEMPPYPSTSTTNRPPPSLHHPRGKRPILTVPQPSSHTPMDIDSHLLHPSSSTSSRKRLRSEFEGDSQFFSSLPSPLSRSTSGTPGPQTQNRIPPNLPQNFNYNGEPLPLSASHVSPPRQLVLQTKPLYEEINQGWEVWKCHVKGCGFELDDSMDEELISAHLEEHFEDKETSADEDLGALNGERERMGGVNKGGKRNGKGKENGILGLVEDEAARTGHKADYLLERLKALGKGDFEGVGLGTGLNQGNSQGRGQGRAKATEGERGGAGGKGKGEVERIKRFDHGY